MRYLLFADAEKIATKLKEQISATVAITTGAPPAGGAAAGGGVAADAPAFPIWATAAGAGVLILGVLAFVWFRLLW